MFFKKKNNFPKHEFEIEHAFTIGGIDYYQYQDITNIPPVRGLKTMVFYEELRMKCTLEYLKLHHEAVNNILSKPGIDIFKIKKLNDQLGERLEIAVETEIIYKLASVVFFDKKENVHDYDYTYNEKKILHWKKHLTYELFFSLKPLTDYLPFLRDANVNFNMCSTMVEELNSIHLESLLKVLPDERITKLKGKSF